MMHADQVRLCLESPEEARQLLRDWQLRDIESGRHNLQHLSQSVGLETLTELCHYLGRFLPRCPDPDMALNNFERFLTSPGASGQLAVLLEGRGRVLEVLLQLVSTSQFFSDLLATNPEHLEMLRIPLRNSPSRAELREQLQGRWTRPSRTRRCAR